MLHRNTQVRSTLLTFEYPEDLHFFATFLTGSDEIKLEKEYGDYFDFRDPMKKRKEFNLLRKHLLPVLMERDKGHCQLTFEGCEIDKSIVVDHLIPLSSNKLNRKLRGHITTNGKKPKTQSFGSNNEKNLILACAHCNSQKKHRLFNQKTRELI